MSTEQPTWFSTRITAGADLLQAACFSEQHGWVLEEADDSVSLELEYVIEEVQHYSALYSGCLLYTSDAADE